MISNQVSKLKAFAFVAGALVCACGDDAISTTDADTADVAAPSLDGGEAPDAQAAPDAPDVPGADADTFADSGVPRDVADVDCSAFERVIESGPLATVTECGVQYRRHAAVGETNAIHTLPDFSHAGYRGGGVAIPDVASAVTLSPLEDEDDTAQIQAAIDEVSAMTPDADGFRGAVVFAAGEYDVSSTLEITTSGVVLRGASQQTLGEGGTVLRARTSIRDRLISFRGERAFDTNGGSRVDITSEYVAVGATRIDVEDATGFSAGERIDVRRTPNDEWLRVTGMDDITDPSGEDESWRASAYEISHLREIESIEGQTLILDIPIVDSIRTDFGGGDVARVTTDDRIHSCGIEDMRLISDYDDDDDEDHAWVAVAFENAENSWARRLTTLHFVRTAVQFESSSFNTAEDVASLDMKGSTAGGRRYAFDVNGTSVGNLFQRCYASTGRHNFVTGSRVPGPNVWLDCLAENSINDDGPHHRWSTGLLFDNIETLQLRVQNRYASGSGHGWSGAQVAFWNVNITSTSVNTSNEKPADIVVDAPVSALSWAVGIIGDGELTTSSRIADQPQGVVESLGESVVPRSLYLAQLEDRLGASAVRSVTIPAQREGTIWNALRAWRGSGLLADFVEP